MNNNIEDKNEVVPLKQEDKTMPLGLMKMESIGVILMEDPKGIIVTDNALGLGLGFKFRK